MVIANNAMRLREIQSAVIEDDNIFGNIESVSISTIDRVLRRNDMSMKQLYKVPFERNSDRVKEIRHQYVQVKHVFYAYSNVHCCKPFTLCSAMHYTYMTVLCMCIHSAYCTIWYPKCIMLHRKSCYSFFFCSLFCGKACTGAGGQGTAAHIHIP